PLPARVVHAEHPRCADRGRREGFRRDDADVMSGRLDGKVVVVIGAGTRPSADPEAPPGNGRAIAIQASREGASVVCVDRDGDAARATAEMIDGEGGTASVLVADVTDEADCERIVAGVDEPWGVVCNA